MHYIPIVFASPAVYWDVRQGKGGILVNSYLVDNCMHRHSCILCTVWLKAGENVLVCQTYRQCRERGGRKVAVALCAPTLDLKSSLLFSDAKFGTVQPSHIYTHKLLGTCCWVFRLAVLWQVQQALLLRC